MILQYSEKENYIDDETQRAAEIAERMIQTQAFDDAFLEGRFDSGSEAPPWGINIMIDTLRAILCCAHNGTVQLTSDFPKRLHGLIYKAGTGKQTAAMDELKEIGGVE